MIVACYSDYRRLSLRIKMEWEEEVTVTAADRQLDERFRPVLAERQIRFNKMQVVPQLQKLCLTVVGNPDYFCSKKDPFGCLRK
jgi:hypothetical protein